MNAIHSAHNTFVNASDRVEYYRSHPEVNQAAYHLKRAEHDAELALARITFHQTGSCAHAFVERVTGGSMRFDAGMVDDTLEDFLQCAVCSKRLD